MKKIIALIILLTLCASITACNAETGMGDLLQSAGEWLDSAGDLFDFADPADEQTGLTVDPNAEAVIILNENDVTQEPRGDEEGNIVGYVRSTGGTNCGNAGTMLIEFLDLDGNVLNSYSPTFAGSVLEYIRVENGDDLFEIQILAETDGNLGSPSFIGNVYELVEHSGGKPRVYKERRGGIYTRCDLYGTDGQVVASVTPENPECEITFDSFQYDCFTLREGYDIYEDDHIPFFNCERLLYYDLDGTLICEINPSYSDAVYTEASWLWKEINYCEVRDTSGAVVHTYEPLSADHSLQVYYNSYAKMVYAKEFDSGSAHNDGAVFYVEEYFDPILDLVAYREEYTYEDDGSVSKEVTVCGGKVVMTEGPKDCTYVKLEFYDAQGTLQQTVEADEGGYMTIEWSMYGQLVSMERYDKNGNKIVKYSSYDKNGNELVGYSSYYYYPREYWTDEKGWWEKISDSTD